MALATSMRCSGGWSALRRARAAAAACASILASGMVLGGQVQAPLRLLVGGALLSVTSVAVVHAEDKTAAREHWERGTKFYDLGKYDEAIREFEAAYEAKSDPAFLYNLAQSHRLAGHTSDALRFYRTYLRYVPKAPNRGDIEQRIRELEKLAAERPATEPAPAPAPASTVPPPAAEGTPASSPSAVNPSPAIGVPPGAPPALEPTFPSGPSPSSTAPGPAFPAPGATDTGDDGSGRRKLGMGIAGAGGGLVLVGAIFGLVARSQSNKVEEAAGMNGRFDPGVESLGQTAETLQWVGYTVGLAAVAGGAILYLTSKPKETAGAPSVALAPMVSPRSGGALMRVTF